MADAPPPAATVIVQRADGTRWEIPAAKADLYQQKYGLKAVSSEALAQEADQTEAEQKYGGWGASGLMAKGMTVARSAADVPTFGGASYLLTREPVARALSGGKMGGEDAAKMMRQAGQANEGWDLPGMAIGMALDPFAALGELKAGASVAAKEAEGLKTAATLTPKAQAVAAETKVARGAIAPPESAVAGVRRSWGEGVPNMAPEPLRDIAQDIPTNLGGRPSPVATAAQDEIATNVGGRPNQAVVPPPEVVAEAEKTLQGLGRGSLGPVRTKFDMAALRAGVESTEPTSVTMTGATGKIDLLAPRAPLPPLRTRLGDLGRIHMADAADEVTGAMTAYEGPGSEVTGQMTAYEPGAALGGENTAARALSLKGRIAADLARDQIGNQAIRGLNEAALRGDGTAVEQLKQILGAGQVSPMSASEAGAQTIFGVGGKAAHEVGQGGIGADVAVDSLTGINHGTGTFSEAQRVGDTIADATRAVKSGSEYGHTVLMHPASTPAQAFVQGAATAAAPGLEATGAMEVAKLEQGLMAHPATAKGLREMAGNMAIGAAYGAGNSLSEQSLHDPAHISGQKLLFGALMGGGIGLFADLGIKGMSAMAKSLPGAVAGAGEGVVGKGFAKYLRDSEAGAGIRNLLGKEGISAKSLESMGGADNFWQRAKKMYSIDTMSIAEQANFGSQKFANRAEEVLAGAQGRHDALMGDLDRMGAKPNASDLLKAYDDQAVIVNQNHLRRADLGVLEREKAALAENLGVMFDPKAGGVVRDGPVSFQKLADTIKNLDHELAGGSIAQGTLGEARQAIRDDLQKILDAKAHEALQGSGGKLATEYGNIRADLDVAKRVKEAMQKAGDEMVARQGPTLGGMDMNKMLEGVGGNLAGAGVSALLGAHTAAAWILGNLVGRVSRNVWKHYGGAISTAFFGKAAQLAAIDTGAQIAARRLDARVLSALDGTMKDIAPKAFDHDATVASIDRLAQMTPDEITRRGTELGQLIAEDAPETAATVTMVAVNALGYLRSNMPKPLPIPFQSAHEPAVYPRDGLVRYADRAEVVEMPHRLCDRIADGTVTKEQAQAVRDTHEVFYEQTRKAVADYIMQLNVPYQQRYRLGWVFDIPADPFLDPGMVIEVDNARQTVQVMQQSESQAPKPGSLRMPFKPNQIMPPPTSATFGGNEQ